MKLVLGQVTVLGRSVMRFKWVFDKDHPQKIKYFVKELGISKALLAKIKFQGGRIEVNGIEKNVLYFLGKQNELVIEIPSEKAHETLLIVAGCMTN